MKKPIFQIIGDTTNGYKDNCGNTWNPATLSGESDPFGGQLAFKVNSFASPKIVLYSANIVNSLDSYSRFTICCRCKIINRGSLNGVLIASNTGQYPGMAGLSIDGKIGNTGTDTWYSSGVDLAGYVGSWHYFEISFDSGVGRFFIDGNLMSTYNVGFTAFNALFATKGVLIGDYGYSYYDGSKNNALQADFYEICFFDYILHTTNYSVPTRYTYVPNNVIYLTGQEAWGINSSGTFVKLSDNWLGETDDNKISVLNATDGQVPTIAELQTLTMPIKVVNYSDVNTQPTCTVSAIPKDQLVLPKNLINLSSIEHINSVTVTANESGTGKVRIAITKGNNVWHMFDGLNFVQIGNTASDFLADGNTASEVNNITQAQWDSFEADEIGFGYVLHIENTTDVANVDNLSMNVLAKGSWNKAVYGTDYTYGYPANNTLRVDILADGDYKINYAK